MGLAATNSNDDGALLKNLVPLNALSDEQLGPLLSQISITKIKKGALLFKEGDLEEQNVYLLTGKIALLTNGKEVDAVNSGSETARYPLAHQFPRLFSAKAKSAVTCVSIDSRLLSDLLLRSQTESEEVEADSEGGDWMSQLLLSPVFQRIPPANMQQVMMRMQEMSLSAGNIVFKQGDEGDYYYMVSRGRCVVTRQANQGAAPIKLAEIGAGHSFGEEALVSQVPRSCTVTMQSNGLLVRLNKDDFLSLVSEPLSHPLSYEDAADRIENGAKWLDIRLPEEHEKESFSESINLPTFSLRFQAFDLDAEAEYIICGDTPALAASAAFLLLEKGYVAYYLNEELHKAFAKQNSTVIDASKLEESDDEELGPDLEEAKENRQRLKQEQIKLRRLEKLYLKTKQSLDAAEQDKKIALEAEEKATKQLEFLGSKLNKSTNQDTELETMEHARDDALAELEELNDSIKEMRESHLLREGELKEQITCLQIELDDVGETNETQQSEFVESQEIVTKINQQLEVSKKEHAAQQQAWQKERDQLESERTILKEQLKTLESGSEDVAQKLQKEMEVLQQELVAAQQSNLSHKEEYAKLKQSEQVLLGKQLEHEKRCEELQQQLAKLQSSTDSSDEEKAGQQAEIEKLTLELENINKKMTQDSGEQSQQLEQIKSELAQEQKKFASENDGYLKQITSLELQLEEATTTSDELSDESAQQQNRIEVLTQELKVLTEQSESNASDQSEWAAEKDEQLKQIATLELQLEEATTTSDELSDESAQQQNRIEVLTQELKVLTEQSESNASDQSEWAAEKDEQLKQIATLELQLEEATTTSGELSDESAQQQNRIEVLTQELKVLTEQSESNASDQSEWAAEKDEQLKQIATLKLQLEEATTTSGELSDESAQQQNRIEVLTQELKVLTEQSESNASDQSEWAAEKDEQLNKYKALLGELEQKNGALDSDKEGLSEEINQLRGAHQKALDEAKKEVDTLENELEKRDQQIDDADGQIDRDRAKQEEQIVSLKLELDKAKGDIERVTTAHKSELSEVQSEIIQLRSALDESNLDKKSESQQAELLREIEKLEVKLKTAEDDEEESISAFQEMIDDLMVRKDDFKGKCEQLQGQLEQLTEERNRQSKVMKKLTLQLDELQMNSTSTSQTNQLDLVNKTLQKERDSAIESVKVSQHEVNELRAVIEQHVEDIKLAQSGEQVEALQCELETVRLQTTHDIKKLRCELELVQSQSVDERDPSQVMAEQQMRQELDSTQQALKDKEVLLNDASKSMRKMEDSLEERDTHADKLQLEIDRLQEMLDEMLQQGLEPLTSEFVDVESDGGNDSSRLKRMFKAKK